MDDEEFFVDGIEWGYNFDIGELVGFLWGIVCKEGDVVRFELDRDGESKDDVIIKDV
ncbi:hypothetical protein [Staphylococcus saprophyticus]|uniref:hypothetical protein n=1 Tax=Staphylococcus saprophyticus TaxID=29385 RepID=UPI0016434EC5|nr:hypothetical protein [Staphylococcus saprophyticus]